MELLRRGLEDESPACRGSALVSLELLSRDAPGGINAARPLLHRLVSADDNQAVRRLAIVCLRNGSPSRDTLVLLNGLADDDEADRDLRDVAKKVAAALKKKSAYARSVSRAERPLMHRRIRRQRTGLSRTALAPLGVRVGGEVRFAAALVRHVRVELGRGEIGVPEHLLDRAEVGAALEQMGRERVA